MIATLAARENSTIVCDSSHSFKFLVRITRLKKQGDKEKESYLRNYYLRKKKSMVEILYAWENETRA